MPMIDMILHTSSQSAMNGAIVNSGLYDPAENPGSQGGMKNKTHWSLNDIGTIYEQTGTTTDEFGNTVPVMTAKSGYYCSLRWNGDEPEPAFKPNVEIPWRSDMVDANGDPVPRPSWFMPILL